MTNHDLPLTSINHYQPVRSMTSDNIKHHPGCYSGSEAPALLPGLAGTGQSNQLLGNGDPSCCRCVLDCLDGINMMYNDNRKHFESARGGLAKTKDRMVLLGLPVDRRIICAEKSKSLFFTVLENC